MTNQLRINGQRLWDSIMAMAKIGATAGGGSHRLALSDEDKQGRDLFAEWCAAAGCTMTVDRMGNMFARRPGKDNSLPPVAMGSHLDTQPYGGKFDGVFGVLSGLEVIRTLNEKQIETIAPLEIVNWTNEEGARFAPAMLASGVFSGDYDLEFALSRTATDNGAEFAAELERIGYAGDVVCGNHPFTAYIEPHIEQGPILEREGKSVGVVTDVQGFRWYDISFTGFPAHTGSTPMVGRRNALLGTARVIQAVDGIADQYAPDARGTVGSQFRVYPGSRNIIPGKVEFTVDFRHPSADTIATMDAALREACQQVADELKLELKLEQISYTPPTPFAEKCVSAVQSACEMLGVSHQRILSGAGHDACWVAKVSPTSMIFVPCKDGVSHNEAESSKKEDLEAGCNVLLHAVLELAGT
jgi:beta-ureidopropionase / N-carbamoyl-L-amino-acid hydrolase